MRERKREDLLCLLSFIEGLNIRVIETYRNCDGILIDGDSLDDWNKEIQLQRKTAREEPREKERKKDATAGRLSTGVKEMNRRETDLSFSGMDEFTGSSRCKRKQEKRALITPPAIQEEREGPRKYYNDDETAITTTVKEKER